MSKSQFYLSQCDKAASKSPMCFTLGAVLVKGGKIISSGYNHHRPHYDGGEVGRLGKGHRKPVSMHAEMHAIFNATGMSPAFKKQVQGVERRVPQRTHYPIAPKVPGPDPRRLTVAVAAQVPRRISSKLWESRRRDPRVNGADIYVARFTKSGVGPAKPCWRCLEWCRWAGVKRIFHWNGDTGKFDVVKVNEAQGEMYETHADGRLYAGL
ncbi:hypothetical protein SISNIDRAFT_473603 [Sistotremastrum niveocremeum HHB9708]|uniref:CMP/dCMP-type deaminase domain-containing protein n=1 Tax=Sistotremastrum niveocremeum HHB9708 TaxID=1314777 RepID=A0A164WZH3_9AGAM|nr:hypothetical protein SISNIDRAFT_473603 [Sistotremastrum niveocremeum HHB9708]